MIVFTRLHTIVDTLNGEDGGGGVCLFVPQWLDSAQRFAATHSDAFTKFAKTLLFKQTKKNFKKWKKKLWHILKHDISTVVVGGSEITLPCSIISPLAWKVSAKVFIMRLPALHVKDGKVGQCASSSIYINFECQHSAHWINQANVSFPKPFGVKLGRSLLTKHYSYNYHYRWCFLQSCYVNTSKILKILRDNPTMFAGSQIHKTQRHLV